MARSQWVRWACLSDPPHRLDFRFAIRLPVINCHLPGARPRKGGTTMKYLIQSDWDSVWKNCPPGQAPLPKEIHNFLSTYQLFKKDMMDHPSDSQKQTALEGRVFQMQNALKPSNMVRGLMGLRGT